MFQFAKMKNQTILITLILTILFIPDLSFGGKTQNTNTKPNLVFILADDCTHWDIGCYGSVDSKTPNIDKLAEEGIKFNRCYQSAPMCSPTRHNIYTGLYPVKTGAYPNHTRAINGTKSMVHYLKPLGYRVAQAGKRHIQPEEVFPFEYLGNDKNPDFNKVEGFLKDVNSSKEPFALVLCSNEPHTPWDKGDASMFDPVKITLPPHYVDTKETREAFCTYLAEINYLDGQVARTLKLLEKYGFDENTLVVFASEQGNSFPFAKWTLYEAGVKSGLIARMPAIIKAGIESDAIVEYADILPTFIELAGGNIPTELDGKSLVPVFKNPNENVKDFAFSIHTTRGINSGSEYYGIRAVVNKNYRYIWNLTPEAEFKNTVNNSPKINPWFQSWLDAAETNEEAKILVQKYSKRPEEELYNIKNDKWCLVNLAEDEAYSDIKKELREELLKWMKACGDEGQKTEMQALDNMPRHIKKK
jgi:N-sulfoglucosamine sulfohydrolase